MSNKFYELWNGSNTPDELPSGCERKLHIATSWQQTEQHPSCWTDGLYRWPVPEYIWRTNRFCEAFGIIVPEEYDVVDFRKATTEDHFLFSDGEIINENNAFWNTSRMPVPILSKKDEWITPTDEDAKLRPIVEFSNQHCKGKTWITSTLVYVGEVFIDYKSCQWTYCRVRKSEIERLRKEKGCE